MHICFTSIWTYQYRVQANLCDAEPVAFPGESINSGFHSSQSVSWRRDGWQDPTVGLDPLPRVQRGCWRDVGGRFKPQVSFLIDAMWVACRLLVNEGIPNSLCCWLEHSNFGLNLSWTPTKGFFFAQSMLGDRQVMIQITKRALKSLLLHTKFQARNRFHLEISETRQREDQCQW